MKLRYIFIALIAALTLAAGCNKETIQEQWDEIQVSKTYVAIPLSGGSTTVTVTAKEAWSVTASTIPSWLTISPTSGNAGETKVTFTAAAAKAGTGVVPITITCGGKTQFVNVLQGLNAAESSTCAQVIAGPDSKKYRVSGVVTAIANTTYGNFYLDDGTGSIYIYGTKNASGSYAWSSFGIELGDVVTVEGPKSTYNGTVELVDATFISVQKALLKVVTPSAKIEKEGGDLVVKVAYKGNGTFVSIPAAYQSWISYTGMDYVAGVPSKLVASPADTAVVKFKIAANEGGDRTGEIAFKSANATNSSSVTYSFSQIGAIVDANSSVINAAADGTTQYRYTGYITKVRSTVYGNIDVADGFGSVYVYGTLNAAGTAKSWSSLGVNAGDIITIVGPKGSYKGSPQLVNAKYESHKAVTATTVAEFLAKSDSKDVYYRLSGTVSGVTSTDLNGRFTITDSTGSVYVFGLLNGWGGATKQFQTLGIVNGDNITIVGYRTSYKGTNEVGGGFFVSKTATN